MHVLVLCDDIWHPACTVHSGLEPLAAEFSFDRIEGAVTLAADQMAAYPLVILAKSNNISAIDETPWATETIASAFRDNVSSGQGLVVIHSGTAGYADLPALHGLIGGTFVSHPPQCPVTVEPRPGHPLGAGCEPFTVLDEHYQIRLDDPQAEVFLTTVSAHGSQPGGWMRLEGAGRVCVLTPGHNVDVWLHPSYQMLLRSALHWCGKISVD